MSNDIQDIFKAKHKEAILLETESYSVSLGEMFNFYYREHSKVGIFKILKRKDVNIIEILGEFETWDDSFSYNEFEKLKSLLEE